jgi:hypothetical protein
MWLSVRAARWKILTARAPISTGKFGINDAKQAKTPRFLAQLSLKNGVFRRD